MAVAAALVVGAAGFGAWGISSAATEEGAGGSSLVPMTPCRLLDTRSGENNVGTRATPLQEQETWEFPVWGAHGNCPEIPETAVALVLNVTAVNQTDNGYITLFDVPPRPVVSNVNFEGNGPPTPNSAIVPLSPTGTMNAFNPFGTVDFLIDVFGIFTDFDFQGLTEAEVIELIEEAGLGTAGPAGPAGATGARGPAGADGQNGAAGATGPQGPQGPQGPAGPQGPIAVVGDPIGSGPNDPDPAEACEDGEVYLNTTTGDLWTCAGGEWGLGGSIVGPQGQIGPVGPIGPAGPAGPAGPQGIPGPTGPAGADGAPGPAGPAGPQGIPGPTGPAGADGAPGPAGTIETGGGEPSGACDDGALYVDTAGGWLWTCDGGLWVPLVSLIGPQGATGAAGPAGPAGPQGPSGAEDIDPNRLVRAGGIVNHDFAQPVCAQCDYVASVSFSQALLRYTIVFDDPIAGHPVLVTARDDCNGGGAGAPQPYYWAGPNEYTIYVRFDGALNGICEFAFGALNLGP